MMLYAKSHVRSRDGSFLRGVRYFGGGAKTHSVVMRSETGTVREIESRC